MAVTLALLPLIACRPLFVPLVPASVEPEARIELARDSRLWWDVGRLRLDLVFAEVPQAGWLAVQWFAPDGTEVASDSTWVEPGDAGRGRSLYAPPEVVETPGRWQAVVSFGSSLVRQVSTTEAN